MWMPVAAVRWSLMAAFQTQALSGRYWTTTENGRPSTLADRQLMTQSGL